MQKINFENKPSTNTPINATNLNTLQDNVEDAIDGGLYYKSGDTYEIGSQLYAGGVLTGSAKTIQFSIFLPKLLDNISNITINSINITARGINGYLLNSQNLSDLTSAGVLSVVSIENNCASIQYTSNEAFNTTNNTAVGIYLKDTVITFN